MTEEWRPVPGLEGRYDVSSLGRVRSWVKRASSKMRDTPKILKETVKSHGYVEINLYHSDGKIKWVRVHQLVLTVFKGPPKNPRFICCHNDGNKTNNILSNLRWDSHSSNTQDMYLHGTMTKGRDVVTCKLNEDQIREIRQELKSGKNQREIARKFEITQAQVSNINTRKHWRWLDA